LHLAAGQLESVDREFDAIADAVDSYASEVRQKAEIGDLDIPLNTPSLRFFASDYGKRLRNTSFELAMSQAMHQDLLNELSAFGIKTLADLTPLLNDDFFEARERHPEREGTNEIGLIRDAMMYADIDRYFETAFNSHWAGLDEASCDMLVSKYGSAKVHGLLARHGLDVIDSYIDWIDESEGWGADVPQPPDKTS
jgi:hypothetical protein